MFGHKKEFDNSTIQENYYSVRDWYLSFAPLVIAAILFVFCFIYESSILLYAIMGICFAIFVVLYVRANKRIIQEGGYTLVRAVGFYKKCTKEGIDGDELNQEAITKIIHIAQNGEYAEELSEEQIMKMYEVGRSLVTYGKERS